MNKDKVRKWARMWINDILSVPEFLKKARQNKTDGYWITHYEEAVKIAEARVQGFYTSLERIEQMIEDNPKVFEGMTYRQRKRLIGYLITQEAETLETEEIFAEQGEEGMMNKDTIEEMKEEEGA